MTLLLLLCSLTAYAQRDSLRFARQGILLRSMPYLTNPFSSSGPQCLRLNVNASVQVSAESDFYYQSTAICIPFAQKLAGNAFIGTHDKALVEQRLRAVNPLTFGYNNEVQVSWTGMRDSAWLPHTRFTLAIKQRMLGASAFTKDAFNLAFYGNAMYAGATATLSGSRFQQISFRQLLFGIQQHLGLRLGQLDAAVSVLDGMAAADMTLPTGTLYTETYGEYLDLNYNLKGHYTGSGSNPVKGMGAALDLGYTGTWKRNLFRFFIKDLGLIAWNNQSTGFDASQSLHYEGVQAGNLLEQAGNGFAPVTGDSVLHYLGVQKQTGSFQTWLPARIGGMLRLYLNGNRHRDVPEQKPNGYSFLDVLISYRYHTDRLPWVSVQWEKRLFCGSGLKSYTWLDGWIMPTLSYGGAGNLDAGLFFALRNFKGFECSLGSGTIQALVLQKQSTSAAAFLRLSLPLSK